MKIDIWEGIYKNFKETPSSGEGFNSERWVKSLLKKTINPGMASSSELFLPFLASMINNKSGNVRILDFGGGIGLSYLQTVDTVCRKKSIIYHIIEKQSVCNKGRRLFSQDKRINFYADFPDGLKIDIVYICSALQYVEDWKACLYKLADYRPKHFLFIDLPAGDIPTYTTVQNYYGSKIPYWFFNIRDIVNAMTSLDFRLLFKSAYIATILGRQGEIPMNNFPKRYRLKHSCDLLFCQA